MRLAVGAATALIATCAPAATWRFTAPPTARATFGVDADWRAHGAVACTVRMVGALPPEPVLCTLYLQNKQDLWIRCRDPLALTGEMQSFSLRLDDLSPDWMVEDAKRPFGNDLLRWVRAWGMEIYSVRPVAGELQIGELVFSPAPACGAAIVDVRLPSPVLRTGEAMPVRFRLEGFAGNPWSSRDVAVRLSWHDGARTQFTPAFYRQDYVIVARADGRPVVQPFEKPAWQADWRPDRPGRYSPVIEVDIPGRPPLSLRLDTVAVADRAATGVASLPTPLPRDDGAFRSSRPERRLVEYRNGRWHELSARPRAVPYWSVPLDWTPRWGRYTGPGEFDTLMAWQFEQAVRQSTNAPLPLAVFDDDVLDESGVLNWKDHPLNRANGGRLARPFDLFRDEEAGRMATDRARYLWARGQGRPGVSGLLILASRPEVVVTNWVDRYAAALSAACPGARILSDNTELLPRSASRVLPVARQWRVDPRLSGAEGQVMLADPRHAVLATASTGSVGVACGWVQHWAGADAVSYDIAVPSTDARTLKVACLLRTEPNTVFQSPLAPLREGDDNRVVFPLGNPAAWTCLQAPGTRLLEPYDLLNVREMALRFFCDEPARITATLGDVRLLWPYAPDAGRRPPLRVTNVNPRSTIVPLYEKFEVDFDLNRVFNNPYDPEDIDVTLELVNPNGATVRHPAYFHEPWTISALRGRETLTRAGRPFWRARFAPTIAGTYDWKLVARQKGETAVANGRFRCMPSSARPGFVRAADQDPRQFEFSNGEFFFPIGCNLRSPGDVRGSQFSADAARNADMAERIGTEAYARWFRQLRQNGANFARVWMSPWWCGLEWNARYSGYHGIGYYNQANAARMDRLLEMAENERICLSVETLNHGCLSTRVDADWHNSPFNLSQPGGIVASPADFFSNRQALAATRNRLRYIAARWGYSAAVAWWGVITEAEWVQPYDMSVSYSAGASLPWTSAATRLPSAGRSPKEIYLDWICDSADFIRRTDAHPHMVSVHFSNPQNGLELWHRPNLDVVRNNAYTKFASFWKEHQFYRKRGVVDVCRVMAQEYEPYRKSKPLIIEEWGGAPTENTESHLLAEIHTGSWGMLMSGTSGVTGYWWWNLVDAKDLYFHFRGIAAFMKGEDRRGRAYRSVAGEVWFPAGPGMDYRFARSAIVLHDRREAFAYVYCDAINQFNTSIPPSGWDDPAFPPSGEGHLELPRALADGRYRVEYWNTFAGAPLRTIEVDVDASRRTIPVPSHRVDMALKIKPLRRDGDEKASRSGSSPDVVTP